MTDDQLDALVASVSPVSDRRVARLPLAGADVDLRDAIVATAGPYGIRTGTGTGTGRAARRPRRVLLAPVAAVVALLVAAAVVPQVGREAGTAWAAPLLAVAEEAPRFVVDAPGWEVVRADEFGGVRGETTFGDGRRELELTWQPAGDLAAIVEDRAASADRREEATVAGAGATLYRYRATDRFTAVWRHGGHAVEASGTFASMDELRGVLRALRPVDVDSWLRAMPPSVVAPAARAAAVDGMLADVPLPDGFDPSSLREGDDVRDRYQLGAVVAGAVACAWIDSWVAVVDAGDASAAQRAVDAMATSHGWRVLVEMDEEGDYPEVLWELADAMPTDAPVSGGRPLTIREAYGEGLGCTTR